MAANRVDRPEVVAINQDYWRIIWLDDAQWYGRHLDDDADALTFNRERTIFVRTSTKDVMEQYYQMLLVHELLHACMATNWGTHAASEAIREMDNSQSEEYFCGMLASPIVFMLKNNPQIVKYLLSDGTVQR